VDSRNAAGLHQDELREIAKLLSEIDYALSRGIYKQVTELTRTAKWLLDRRIELMFA
jgi:hypothetical protein